MNESFRYYQFAEEAAGSGEVTFLRHCLDEILRQSEDDHSRPDYRRLFKTLYEARLFFLNQASEASPAAESLPQTLMEKLREIDDLTTTLLQAADGAPITETIRQIRSLGLHPMTPKK